MHVPKYLEVQAQEVEVMWHLPHLRKLEHVDSEFCR